MINNILNINFNNINEVENTLETISQNFMSDNLIIVIGINIQYGKENLFIDLNQTLADCNYALVKKKSKDIYLFAVEKKSFDFFYKKMLNLFDYLVLFELLSNNQIDKIIDSFEKKSFYSIYGEKRWNGLYRKLFKIDVTHGAITLAVLAVRDVSEAHLEQ